METHFAAALGCNNDTRAASLVAGAFCLVLKSFVSEPQSFLGIFGYLALLGGSSMVVYLAAAWVLGSRNIRNLKAILTRRGA